MSNFQLSELGKLVNDNILHLENEEHYIIHDLYFQLRGNETLDDFVYSLCKSEAFSSGQFILKECLLNKVAHSLYLGNKRLLAPTTEYSLTDFKPIKIEVSLKINGKSVVDYESYQEE
jgi:hypothetical protein